MSAPRHPRAPRDEDLDATTQWNAEFQARCDDEAAHAHEDPVNDDAEGLDVPAHDEENNHGE